MTSLLYLAHTRSHNTKATLYHHSNILKQVCISLIILYYRATCQVEVTEMKVFEFIA